jgi:hypothetical protein
MRGNTHMKNNLSKTITKILFYSVSTVLFVWSASMTVEFLGNALPDMPLVKYAGLVIFDLGALAWLAIFIMGAEGAPQRSISLLLCIFDLLGVGLMVTAEVMLSGQQFAAAPDQLFTIALWSICIWTLVNLFGVFGYHLTDPGTRQQIAQRSAEDQITEIALKQLSDKTALIASDVANQLSGQLVDQTLSNFGYHHRNGHNKDEPLPELTSPKEM